MTLKIPWNFANKGPCDSGFHIPEQMELANFITMLTRIGLNAQADATYTDTLLIPPAYYLNRSTWTINTSYWIIRLWTCTFMGYSSQYAFQIHEASASGSHVTLSTDKPANWFPIRAFKDTPVIPDNTWTVQYQWTWDNGVFRNSSKGLISTVYNWTCVTIQDHNVWATVVWQPWNTVDDTNAGLFYQWWNNYGFPYSWATEFYTSTQAATWYWPDNPYLDSHFVKVSSNNRFFNASGVTNIRWWEWAWVRIPTEPKKITYKHLTGEEVWHNDQLGLFSFTRDFWSTWTTIADKDLWANAVWWEWNLFQWWNDYWFPATGTVTRSTTSVNVDNYWPKNHYNTSTWTRSTWNVYTSTYSSSATATTYWSNLWGGFWTIEDMQWPCPSGWHIPSRTEMNNLLIFLRSCLNQQNIFPSDIVDLLFMPCAGSLRYETWTPSTSQGYGFRYWTSTPNDASMGNYFYWNNSWWSSSSYPLTISYTGSTCWFSIRPFKNTAVIPDSTWTKLRESNLFQIWWSESEGIISYTSDWWTTWNSISDKNLWATTVYHSTDTLTEANCWKFYQWGNNYGFPFTWATKTTTLLASPIGYWPWNYYNSDEFILSSNNGGWLVNPIQNLRWWLGVTADRRWPCPEGFHIPTSTEWNDNILGLHTPLGFRTSGHYRYSQNGSATTASSASLGWWTCLTSTTTRAYKVGITTSSSSSSYMYYQYYIRPFKDVTVVPTVEDWWVRTYQWTYTRTMTAVYNQWNKVRPSPSTKIVLNAYTKTLVVGNTFTIKATLQPEATHDTVTWSTSDSTIATVNSSWVITAVGAGIATITATTTSWLTATCTVTITSA